MRLREERREGILLTTGANWLNCSLSELEQAALNHEIRISPKAFSSRPAFDS